MISYRYCELMARYNCWQNEQLYALCATLSPAFLNAERGAFFGSIFATLNHLLYADLAFLSRFTGEPPEVPPLGVNLYDSFAALATARRDTDTRLERWCADLDDGWLAAAQTYTSKVDGVTRTRPRWELLAHLFNHQAHHRGQITTLLSQAGLDAGPTDLPFMPASADAALADCG